MRYKYTDLDGNRLIIENTDWPANTASVSVNGNAVFVKAAEAPKAAQAILDAAGVKGAVIVGSNINVTLGAKAEQAWEKRQRAENDEWLARCAEEKAAEEDAAKKAHDDLRTSPIALKALEIYNRGCIGYGPYANWDAASGGRGVPDFVVKEYIARVEEAEAKEKEAAAKLGARRDALAKELVGQYATDVTYRSRTKVFQRAIDRIIELEDAK